MKKKLLIAAAAILVIALAVGGSMAAFTADVTTVNKITMGSVKLAVHQYHVDENGTRSAWKDADAVNVIPGEKVSQIVTVENTGSSDAWIRVKPVMSVALAEENKDATVDISMIGLDGTAAANWTQKDGWYYYTKALKAGATTEPVYTGIAFAAAMDNAWQGSSVQVTVDAQGVQSANNGSSALTATAWPAA